MDFKYKNAFKLIISILFCQLAGLLSGIFTESGISNWYNNLEKPAFTPPNWVFAPVWITLYALMGISFFLIWKNYSSKNRNVKLAIILFFVQLFLNVIWSPVFFGFKQIFGGLIIILLLFIAILLTILQFYKVSKPAALLLIPYLIWVGYATVLNFYILRLN